MSIDAKLVKTLRHKTGAGMMDCKKALVEANGDEEKAIEVLMKDRTALVIAHRLSTVQNADKIIVLEKGEIIEVGSHTDLYNKGGLYRRLYDIQFE